MIAAALVPILWAQAAAPAAPSAPEAAALPIDLRWDAPAGCPEVAAVRAAIARGLPAAPAGVAPSVATSIAPSIATSIAPMTASIVLRALDADHWQASLELRGPDWTATRALKGASCAAVADAASLVIGLALTSELAARPVVVAPAPGPPRPPAPALSTPLLGLSLAGESGALPEATMGGAIALGWRWTHARAELRGSLFASRAGSVATLPDAGGRLSLASLAARACALWGATLSAGPCVGAGVDRLHGQGTGPIAAAEATSLAPFVAPGLRGEWRLSRPVAAFLDVEGAIPLVRARFSVENVGLVHQAAPVSLRGAAGLELRFR
jgi:hypothetical protein